MSGGIENLVGNDILCVQEDLCWISSGHYLPSYMEVSWVIDVGLLLHND